MEVGFFLKKFVSFFLEPLGLVVLMMAFGFWFLLKNRLHLAKFGMMSGTFLLLLFAYPPFASWLITPLESSYTKLTPDASYADIEYIHVLGSGHSVDADQSISSKLSPAGVKRVLEGVLLHRALPNSKLIFTGYEGDTNTSNAQMNASLALALGVLKENIIINAAPKDTQEEALFCATIVGSQPTILVTSASHMQRAVALFTDQGIEVVPAATDFHKEEFLGYLRAPRAYYFHVSSVAIHEYLGLLWSSLKHASLLR